MVWYAVKRSMRFCSSLLLCHAACGFLPWISSLRSRRCGAGSSRGLWQSALESGLSRPIDVKDHSLVTYSINNPTSLLLFAQRAREQILQKKLPQVFCGGPSEADKKATERRARRQPVTPEERPEGLRPGGQPFVERLQRVFAADRVTEKDGHKVDDFETPQAAAVKVDSLSESVKDSPLCAGAPR
jgi:hypothetical protein